MIKWLTLIAGSAAMAFVLELLTIPAAFMLGPLIAAGFIQSAVGRMKVPSVAMTAAQAIIGCLIARSITAAFVYEFMRHWPLLLGVVLTSLVTSGAIGWTMSRFNIVPGTASIWGMLPGGATVMMILAEAYGADIRIVAFMQYVRVVLVAAAAAALALTFGHGMGSHLRHGLIAIHSPRDVAATLMLISAGGLIGNLSRIPAGALLVPMAAGALLTFEGLIKIEIPALLAVFSYAVVGWNTGLRFTREVMAIAWRVLPSCVAATTILMGVCGALSWALVLFLRIDPITAYLATTPGGLDTAAVLASSIKVDVPFVMAFQTVRVVVLILAGPHIARWIAGALTASHNKRAAAGE